MLDDLTLIHTDLTPALARLRVSLPRPAAAGGWRLAGHLRGPRSTYAETLPASYPLRDLGAGDKLSAECTVPDPCYWSPEYPLLYELRVELLEDGSVRERVERIVGLRRLGVRGSDLVEGARRWVLRAVQRRLAPETTLAAWHDAETAMLVEGLDEQLLAEASALGVLVVTQFPGGDDDPRNQLRRLARWPAAGVAVLPAHTRQDWDPTTVAPQVVLAQQCPAGKRTVLEPWCRLAWCEVDDPHEFSRRVADWRVPVVAVRPASSAGSLEQLRAGCDRLQRDLAPLGQYAGYVVSMAGGHSAWPGVPLQ